jgi:hypothetical protein
MGLLALCSTPILEDQYWYDTGNIKAAAADDDADGRGKRDELLTNLL